MANVHFSSVFNFVLIIANQKGMSYHHWIEAFHKDFPTHYMITRELSHTKKIINVPYNVHTSLHVVSLVSMLIVIENTHTTNNNNRT